MAYFNTGTAAIDKKIQIVKADKEFYQFIAWENPMFLEKSVCKKDFAQLKSAIDAVFQSGEGTMVTYRVLRPDESLHWVVADLSRVSAGNSEFVVQLAIQSMESLEQELRRTDDLIQEMGIYLDILDELFFKYKLDEDRLCIFIGGEKQRVPLFSGSLDEWEEELLGKGAFTDKYHEIFGELCDDLRQGTKHFSHEIQLPNILRGDNKELYLFKGRTVADSYGKMQVLGCVYTIAKNSRRKKTALGSDMVRDTMTGLLTKQMVTEYARNALSDKTNGNGYLCVLDVDNFKYVNDHFGHMFGDEVLVTVADVIKDAVEGRGVAGRIGGDEMMIFLENVIDQADLRNILRTIRTNVEWAYKGMRDDLHLSCSIGAAAYPKDADNYEDLFKIADKMLYRAKEGGKNRYVIYTPEIHGNVLTTNTAETVPADQNTGSRMSKEHLLLEFSEYFLYKKIWSIKMALEYAGTVFDLAEVDVFYDEPVYQTMHWRADGKELADDMDMSFVRTLKFRQLINEDHLAVINHTVDLEYSCPDAYAVLKAHNVNAALIYEMNNRIPGCVAFFKEGHSSRLWTESDKAYLNMIGKMIDLVIGGK